MVTDEMIEAFGNAFWIVNAASKIDAQREHIRSALKAALSTDAEPVKTAPAVAVKDACAPDLLLYNLLMEAINEGVAKASDPDWTTKDFGKSPYYQAIHAALSAQVQDVAVPALKIGIYGKAYDRPDERRAYTYDEQPHNVEAYKLGRVCSEIHSGGDWIDRGLNLLKALQREGFGVFELPDSPASKHGDAE